MNNFNPKLELMKKVYQTNRFSDRIMKLQNEAYNSFMKESENWGSENICYYRN